MFKLFKCTAVLFVLCGLVLTACRKQEFDEFYGRPEWLAAPIYQQLDSMGNFKNYLACIEKAGYKNTLGTAGSWTVFAPTDEAFQTFFSENNISGVEGISDSLAARIVRISMIYDGEKIDRLNDNFTRTGWVEDVAFRRRTVFYDFVDTVADIPNARSNKYISTNRTAGQPYVTGENNNKNITYFFNTFMSQRSLGAADYNAFYPNATYTGLNVADAEIDPVKHDIVAENGVIHVVNKVLTPTDNIYQYLRDKPQYSMFRNILEAFATYTYNDEVTHRYQVLSGKTDSVFTKSYRDILLAVNNENYAKEDPNDAQINNNSITVPTNTAVQDYASKVLLRYYPAGTKVTDLVNLNSNILKEYVNSHLYNGQLWPSKFDTQNNALGETPKISSSNIVETKLLSNGAFYGVNASQKANVFHTVYGNVLLDPKYTLMRRALDLMGYNLTLKIPTIRYMLVMVPDKTLNAMGFAYDSFFKDPIRYNGGDGSTILRRIMQQHIVPLENYPLPDLAGKGLLESINGEYFQYDNGHLASRGTLDSAALAKPTTLKVDSTSVGVPNVSGPANGIVVYVKGPLSYSNKTIGTHLIENYNANNASSPYYEFFQYLKNSTDMYKASTGEVTGVSLGLNYTFLIPDNAAMAAAKANGIIPTSNNPSALVDKEAVKRFLKYHIVKNSFAIDGKKEGAFESLYKDLDDNTYVVNVQDNTATEIKLLDESGRNITTKLNDSNKLGDRIIIHSLNSYLDYRKN